MADSIMARRNHSTLLLPLIALALTACGGGGGGGNGSSTNPTASNNESITAITAGNMTSVASAGANSVAMNVSIQQITTDYVIGAEIRPDVTTAKSTSFPMLTIALLQEVSGKWRPEALATGAQFVDSWQCEVSGRMQVSGTVSNIGGENLQTGDKINMVLSDCNQGGVILNGAVDITVVSAAGDLNLVGSSASDALTYRDFKITTGSDAITVNGSATLDTRMTADKLIGSITADSLSYQLQRGAQTATLALAGHKISFERDEYTSVTTSTLSGTSVFNFPALRGKFSISTLNDISAYADGAITAGKVKILGDNSVLYLTYLGSSQIKVELDSNNDGLIDSTTTSTLTSLDTQLWQ